MNIARAARGRQPTLGPYGRAQRNRVGRESAPFWRIPSLAPCACGYRAQRLRSCSRSRQPLFSLFPEDGLSSTPFQRFKCAHNHVQECLVKQSLWQLNRVKSRAAVQAEGGRLWMTGKKWARLFQVKIKKLPEVRTSTAQPLCSSRRCGAGSATAARPPTPQACPQQACTRLTL